MAYVGTLSVIEDNGSAGDVYSFINVNFPGGWPEDALQRVGEPITAMGVDGTRARHTRQDYPQFVLKSYSEAASFYEATTIVTGQRSARLKRCTLTLISDGVTYTFGTLKAYIWAVSPKPIRADVVTSLGSIASPQGLVITDWTLQFIPAV